MRRIVLKVQPSSKSARFEVHDTGPGLDPGVEPNLFDPFVRGNVGGVSGIGLGLATVKRMAEAYGGAVGVHTVKGERSVFWFDFSESS